MVHFPGMLSSQTNIFCYHTHLVSYTFRYAQKLTFHHVMSPSLPSIFNKNLNVNKLQQTLQHQTLWLNVNRETDRHNSTTVCSLLLLVVQAVCVETFLMLTGK